MLAGYHVVDCSDAEQLTFVNSGDVFEAAINWLINVRDGNLSYDFVDDITSLSQELYAAMRDANITHLAIVFAEARSETSWGITTVVRANTGTIYPEYLDGFFVELVESALLYEYIVNPDGTLTMIDADDE